MMLLIRDVRFNQRVLLLLRSKKGVRACVCMRVQSKQTVNKYIFLALVSSGSIMCTYSIVITVMDCVRLVLPLSFSFLCYSKAQ